MPFLHLVSIEDQPALCRLAIDKRDGASAVGAGLAWPATTKSPR
jgi:hypothetical protein